MAYFDFRGCLGTGRYELSAQELQQIGRFTRENISKWLNSLSGHEWVSILPVEDFYAVCGDVVVPWANENNERIWREGWPNKKHLCPEEV